MHYCLDAKGIKKFPVAMRPWVTPVPIPNTTVKTWAAESTILATVWEDRWLPDHKKDNTYVVIIGQKGFCLLMTAQAVRRMYLENRILK